MEEGSFGLGVIDESRSAETVLSDSVVITQLDKIVAWGRKYSFFLYPFVTACCGMEFMSVAGPRYDIDRFGAALPRFSPRQADLLMVVGTISHKQAPILVKVYNQMTEPKWVFAFGSCVVSGGMYNNYATVQGIDSLIPVDVYVPGCPPRPEIVLDGLIKLQEKVETNPNTMMVKGIATVGEADDRKIT
ncbi:MAG TPA: NADH-quinone oxidoreductase subunit NuoB [Nitrospinota bacterium]|nr:NADH-quinone oxidoreductase subunit NuoB [Nitrospinota bacterium]|tara:strand:+ start:91933 stop:92499 length:567 start_codon:yes stop_codon:yes gene_type:complete